jgi:hypothetical protein
MSRIMRQVGRTSRRGKRRGASRCVMGKPEGTGPFGRSRRRWEDNIKRYMK